MTKLLLENKVIVITGGSGLLGQEFVKAVRNEGGHAVNTDIHDTPFSCSSLYIQADITSLSSIQNLIQATHAQYGKIDAVVNNAYPRNKAYGKSFFDVSYESFCENVNTHLGGYFLVSQQFSGYFKSQGFGSIVNIASIYGVIPPKFEIYEGTSMTMPVEYAVAKSGLIHLTKYMAQLLKGTNIRVNALSPGGILDNQPQSFVEKYAKRCTSKGMLESQNISGTLVYLLSDMATYVTGQNIIVDDGFSLC